MSGRAPELLTYEEFSEIFRVCVDTVRNQVRAGNIVAVTHPDLQCSRIPYSQVRAFRKQWTPTNGKPIRPARNGRAASKKAKGGTH